MEMPNYDLYGGDPWEKLWLAVYEVFHAIQQIIWSILHDTIGLATSGSTSLMTSDFQPTVLITALTESITGSVGDSLQNVFQELQNTAQHSVENLAERISDRFESDGETFLPATTVLVPTIAAFLFSLIRFRSMLKFFF